MASIFASFEVVQTAIDQTDMNDGIVVIAAINGPSATVVSGNRNAVEVAVVVKLLVTWHILHALFGLVVS